MANAATRVREISEGGWEGSIQTSAVRAPTRQDVEDGASGFCRLRLQPVEIERSPPVGPCSSSHLRDQPHMKTRTFRKILRTLLVATLSLAGVLGVGYVVLTMIPVTFPEYEEPDFEQAIEMAREALKDRGVNPDKLAIAEAYWFCKADPFDGAISSGFRIHFQDPDSREDIHEGLHAGGFTMREYSVGVHPANGIAGGGIHDRTTIWMQDRDGIRGVGTGSRPLRGTALTPSDGPLREPDFEEIGQAATRLVEHYFPLTRWGGMELHKIEFHHVEERLESRGHETGTMVVSLLHNRGEPGYETHPDPDGRDRPWARRFDSNSVYTIPIAPDRRVRFHDIQRHGILDVRMSAASAQRETMSPEAGE